MRKSRLYLALSIISLVFGVAVVGARGHCSGGCPFSLRGSDCQTDMNRPSEGDQLRADTMRLVQTGDYATMETNACRLIKLDPNDPFHHEMLGYARRGKKLYEPSNLAYEQALRLAMSDEHANAPVICDSHIAMAANYQALGDRKRALENINTAVRLADQACRIDGDKDDYYQLACALAVRSTIREGVPALKDRNAALTTLGFAIDRGFDSWAHMAADLDLAGLHGSEGFAKLFPNNKKAPAISARDK